MRRLPSVLLLAALALAVVGFAPAPVEAPAVQETPAVQAVRAEPLIVCVKFRDWDVPLTGITWEAPYERFCVDAPSVPRPQQ